MSAGQARAPTGSGSGGRRGGSELTGKAGPRRPEAGGARGGAASPAGRPRPPPRGGPTRRSRPRTLLLAAAVGGAPGATREAQAWRTETGGRGLASAGFRPLRPGPRRPTSRRGSALWAVLRARADLPSACTRCPGITRFCGSDLGSKPCYLHQLIRVTAATHSGIRLVLVLQNKLRRLFPNLYHLPPTTLSPRGSDAAGFTEGGRLSCPARGSESRKRERVEQVSKPDEAPDEARARIQREAFTPPPPGSRALLQPLPVSLGGYRARSRRKRAGDDL